EFCRRRASGRDSNLGPEGIYGVVPTVGGASLRHAVGDAGLQPSSVHRDDRTDALWGQRCIRRSLTPQSSRRRGPDAERAAAHPETLGRQDEAVNTALNAQQGFRKRCMLGCAWLLALVAVACGAHSLAGTVVDSAGKGVSDCVVTMRMGGGPVGL